MTLATGTFDVALEPQTPGDGVRGADLSRMAIRKQFRGDLNATSVGEMLAVGTAVDGSAGYVALERVSGTLLGRSGTFVLQHSGIMARGTPQLVITVVPDSGTAQLAGLSGTMAIVVADGKHAYTLDCAFASEP